jgi:DNA-directed RNA polymerase subunit L
MEHMQQDRKFLYIHARDEKQRARELEKKLDKTSSELDEFKEKL